MAANLNIAAEVVDIQSDAPRTGDAFLVDTHVWYWLTYTRCSLAPKNGPRHYQSTWYPKYIKSALSAKARICWTGYYFAELAHLIEKCEYDIFHAAGSTATRKEFRHNFPAERSAVVKEIEAAWQQMESIGSEITCATNRSEVTVTLSDLGRYCVDSYDSLSVRAAQIAGVPQVLSDDGDVATIPGLRVFTANRNVVEQARAAGKLVRR